jgi:hypothetical protein
LQVPRREDGGLTPVFCGRAVQTFMQTFAGPVQRPVIFAQKAKRFSRKHLNLDRTLTYNESHTRAKALSSPEVWNEGITEATDTRKVLDTAISAAVNMFLKQHLMATCAGK